jgi:precorrin-2 dehydrogenase/sirohydrochlorin ferrochelatase
MVQKGEIVMYPVMLNLEGNPCLVVGGGSVAIRKVEGLLSEGAFVTVVAPEIDGEFENLEKKDKVRIERRCYQTGEAAAGYFLIMAATNDREVNRQVYLDAKECGIWVNVADDPELCTFYLPARMKRGPLQLVIASQGLAPFAMSRLRKLLENRFGPQWEAWIRSAGEYRKAVYEKKLSKKKNTECFQRFFDETVDTDKIEARIPSKEEMIRWLTD